jgi:LPS export ABC transporter protein LptC
MTPERTRAVGALLAIAALGSYGLLRYFRPDEAPAPKPEAARQDNEIRGVEMRVFDANGVPNLVLVSPRIASPRRGDEYLIEAPLFDVVSEKGARWKGEARIGRLDIGADTLWLEDDVRLLGTRENRAPATIAGERIEFRMTERVVVSEESVSIRQGDSVVTGQGLRADLTKDRVVLQHDVEGVYVTQKNRG